MGKLKDTAALLLRSFRRLISLSFILLTMLLLVRLYELVVTSNFANYPPGTFFYLLSGIKFDLLIYFRITALLAVPFLLLALVSQKTAKIFFVVSSLLLVFADMLLLKYFATARVPLGADLFGYSMDEIRETVQSSGKLNITPFVFMFLFLAYMAWIFRKHVYYRLKPWMMAVFAVLMFVAMLPLKIFSPQPSGFNNEFSMFAAVNKLGFFAESVVNRYLLHESVNDQSFVFNEQVNPESEYGFTFIDEEYPFLHKETTPDIFSQYVDSLTVPPNFVFIVVEGLGRAYSGEGAYLGSFTPFLDSLMEHSLYWENCLSTSGRTFQVLPSLLASVPFGARGFAEMGAEMPDHISLISLLKMQAGYRSSFVYGSEASFDKMDLFLKRQGIDNIIEKKNFGEGYETLPAMEGGFSWGYGDREIFTRYLEEIKSENRYPRIDIMLTLAMHDPFLVPGQQRYLAKFNQRLEKTGLSEKTKSFNRTYERQFSTIMYMDEALQHFFNQFSKLPSFRNTIFIITGDHRMPEIPISTQLDRFHVPLVIYSPLFKKAEKFSSIVTHFDVTPSLLALLDGQKIISRPPVASWIGHGLDNETEFRCLNAYPLMRNKNELLDYISDEKMLANNMLYKIYDNMYIEPIDEREATDTLKAEFKNFILKNNYVCTNNKLIPDSLKKYTFR